MMSAERDHATLVLLGLERHLWDQIGAGERSAYRIVMSTFMGFLLLSLISSVYLVYLIVSSWWLAVPAGVMLALIIGSVVRFSLIILRRSIFDPFLSDSGADTPTRDSGTVIPIEPAVMQGSIKKAPVTTPAAMGVSEHMAKWKKAVLLKIRSKKPGMDSFIRVLIISLMGCLVVFPLSALFHHGALESENQSRRSELLARYTSDERGSLGARTSWIERRIDELEKDLSDNAGSYRSDGLLLEKTSELERLRKGLQIERASMERDLAILTGQYRERLERSHFLMHSFRAVTGMPAFLPLLLLVGGLLLIPHLLLAKLKTKGQGSYAELSTLYFRSIIEEEYKRTEDLGYARLQSVYGYDPDMFKKNIHWENTPYNTVPRKLFDDRIPMTRDEFEDATATQKHAKP